MSLEDKLLLLRVPFISVSFRFMLFRALLSESEIHNRLPHKRYYLSNNYPACSTNRVFFDLIYAFPLSDFAFTSAITSVRSSISPSLKSHSFGSSRRNRPGVKVISPT